MPRLTVGRGLGPGGAGATGAGPPKGGTPSWIRSGTSFSGQLFPIALLLLAAAASAYGLKRRRPRPPENAQDRVARAYRDATSQAAGGGSARQPAYLASQAIAAHPGQAATAPRAGMTAQ